MTAARPGLFQTKKSIASCYLACENAEGGHQSSVGELRPFKLSNANKKHRKQNEFILTYDLKNVDSKIDKVCDQEARNKNLTLSV